MGMENCRIVFYQTTLLNQKKVIQDKNSAYYFFLPEVYFYLNKVLFLHQYSVSATFSLSPFLSSTPTSPRQSD